MIQERANFLAGQRAREPLHVVLHEHLDGSALNRATALNRGVHTALDRHVGADENFRFSIFDSRFLHGRRDAVRRVATRIATSSFASSRSRWIRERASNPASAISSSQKAVSSASSSTMLVLLMKSARDFERQRAR